MSEAARQVMSVLGSCEKSRDHLRQDISIEHRGSLSWAKRPYFTRPTKALFLKGALVLKLL